MLNAKLMLLAMFLCTLATLAASHAGEAKPGFRRFVLKDADGKEAPYFVFVPHGYKGDKAYPVILFLHGAGETSNEKKLLQVGLGPAVKKREKNFPFIAVFPLALERDWKSDNGKRAIAILDEVKKTFKVDDKRIYLTGLSMGGYGTWSLAVAHPDRWAAIAPICGGGDPSKADNIKHIPCWCFHGDADKAVPVEKSREMIKALKDAGGKPRYDEYPGVGHNSWDRAYGNDELYTWFLKHKLK